MPPIQRKLITIIAESALENRLVRDMKGFGVSGYTVFDVRGEGTRGKRKGDWDHNRSVCLTSICQSDLAHAILDHIAATYFEDYAIVAYLSDVEVHRGNKF
ncbi:P-II family nitrogen regulator [Chrysiogenes arsenatis]|uniref:P-II family nitrogen regulator n=1 Tax=Chrysiogenes arsenatis TaxID=309797 RepID=UPI00041F0138|nr:hypothetical protein [Chrysiogenes arsenatis]